jgi:hypothetical protein
MLKSAVTTVVVGDNVLGNTQAFRERGASSPETGGVRLRGRDSNPNFLVQSQASYR